MDRAHCHHCGSEDPPAWVGQIEGKTTLVCKACMDKLGGDHKVLEARIKKLRGMRR